MKYYITLVLLTLFFSSCKKDLVEIDSNYQGEWHTASVIIDSGREIENFFIIDGSNGIYAKRCDVDPMGANCSVYHVGVAQTTKRQKTMYIGSPKEDGRLRIRIDEPPHLNSDGQWECTLMGEVFIRN